MIFKGCFDNLLFQCNSIYVPFFWTMVNFLMCFIFFIPYFLAKTVLHNKNTSIIQYPRVQVMLLYVWYNIHHFYKGPCSLTINLPSETSYYNFFKSASNYISNCLIYAVKLRIGFLNKLSILVHDMTTLTKKNYSKL